MDLHHLLLCRSPCALRSTPISGPPQCPSACLKAANGGDDRASRNRAVRPSEHGPDGQYRESLPSDGSTRFLRRRIGSKCSIPARAQEPLPGHAVGGGRDEPQQRWQYHLGLQQRIAGKGSLCRYHRCVDRTARYDHVDRHTGAFEIGGHDRTQRLRRGFARPIRRRSTVPHCAETGRDVDDATPLPINHRLDHCAAEKKNRVCVYRDCPGPLAWRHFVELGRMSVIIRPHLSLPDTGVVDEDIDPAEPLLHLCSQFYGVEIGQVCDEPLELRSGGDLLPESCETVHVAIDGGDTEALFKQSEAHRATKALRRSGDKNGPIRIRHFPSPNQRSFAAARRRAPVAADKRPSTSSRSSIVAYEMHSATYSAARNGVNGGCNAASNCLT